MRALLFLLLLLVAASPAARAEQVDLLVYGATPAGIAAALAAAEDGEKVMLVESGSHIGGMLTNGLSQADFISFESLSGSYLRFTEAVVEAYRPEFGDKAGAVSFRGTHAEPKVNQAVLERMVAAQPRIVLHTNWALEGAECSSEANGDAAGPVRALEMALFTEPAGERHSIAARYFIDATYEGDLMAAAGVPYRVGRERAAEYHESLAPAEADAEVQGYNFRFCMTSAPGNRVALREPAEYRREDYAELVPLLKEGKITSAFGPGLNSVFREPLPALPHDKHDLNDMFGGPVRISLPGLNEAWPDGGGGVAIREGVTTAIERPPFSRLALATARGRILAAHKHWTVGLIWFLQHDEEVPEPIRSEALEWGWCRDEFPENGHVPEMLYVREARRLIGQYVFTQNDFEAAPGDDRSPPQADSVAVGDYGPICVGTGHEGSLFGGRHTGDFYAGALPYQIPFGVMVPLQMENLLVPCAVSASHVGYNAIRFEPIRMALGEAAGHAAHLARESSGTFATLSVRKLQERLHAAGAATVYLSDLPPGDSFFPIAQWWGDAGGWHGEFAGEQPSTTQGTEILGGYRQAFRHHAAALDEPLDTPLRARWAKLAEELGLHAPAGQELTRREWLQALHAADTARK